jgi:hypothetical protein
MHRFVTLLALVSLLMLPFRIAEARADPSPDAVIAALDLGHCSGDLGKQHGRVHAHCSIVGEAAADAASLADRLPVRLGRAALPAAKRARGLAARAPTPPPRSIQLRY